MTAIRNASASVSDAEDLLPFPTSTSQAHGKLATCTLSELDPPRSLRGPGDALAS